MFVNGPLTICLIVKIYFGVRWIKMKMSLPALCSYYVISWTFYTSYVLTESLIIMVGWHAFTNEYIACVISTIIVCFIAWFILYYFVKDGERNKRTMNEYRKQAQLVKYK